METPAKVNANPGKGKQKRNTKPAVAEKSQKKAKPVYDSSSDLDKSAVESDSEPKDENAELEDADDDSDNENTEISGDSVRCLLILIRKVILQAIRVPKTHIK